LEEDISWVLERAESKYKLSVFLFTPSVTSAEKK
jgi:hypothetical protein